MIAYDLQQFWREAAAAARWQPVPVPHVSAKFCLRWRLRFFTEGWKIRALPEWATKPAYLFTHSDAAPAGPRAPARSQSLNVPRTVRWSMRCVLGGSCALLLGTSAFGLASHNVCWHLRPRFPSMLWDMGVSPGYTTALFPRFDRRIRPSNLACETGSQASSPRIATQAGPAGQFRRRRNNCPTVETAHRRIMKERCAMSNITFDKNSCASHSDPPNSPTDAISWQATCGPAFPRFWMLG